VTTTTGVEQMWSGRLIAEVGRGSRSRKSVAEVGQVARRHPVHAERFGIVRHWHKRRYSKSAAQNRQPSGISILRFLRVSRLCQNRASGAAAEIHARCQQLVPRSPEALPPAVVGPIIGERYIAQVPAIAIRNLLESWVPAVVTADTV